MMVRGTHPTVSDYRRIYTGSSSYFFTVVMHRRQDMLCNDDIRFALRDAINSTRKTHPFEMAMSPLSVENHREQNLTTSQG